MNFFLKITTLASVIPASQHIHKSGPNNVKFDYTAQVSCMYPQLDLNSTALMMLLPTFIGTFLLVLLLQPSLGQ